jgi:DNA-binding NarL/FixJ family response regulator
LGEAIRRTVLQGTTLNSESREDAPAVIVLGSDDRVVSLTDNAERLLDELADAGAPDPEKLPTMIRAVSLQARSRPRNRHSIAVSLRSPQGHWLTVRAAPLDGGQRVAVVIEQARATEQASLILAAYGLSARERDVAQCVRRGLSTGGISEALHISQYTVQDHLKSIFNKTGFSSRGELAARLHHAA